MKKVFRFDGFDVNVQYESQLSSHPIASGFHKILIVSGELGYEIQIREAVVSPNCLTILRFKGFSSNDLSIARYGCTPTFTYLYIIFFVC
ncbi:hypothetical protein ACE6H2_010885 [Prunus campanulata]